ncbi:RsmB/NOP family class I SAM-dependent RNA methyltransferase [Jatrophihabitans sp.]|uniref:RsmB/NOP family class I SAM-dependent RNA methyltransferase n=1 Tax=Jatrophihabitans sp. TaxID=1932789 RepID=UPI002B8E6737|nr:transcription antitermination factor NusB [Jatrophihabitans sp.]
MAEFSEDRRQGSRSRPGRAQPERRQGSRSDARRGQDRRPPASRPAGPDQPRAAAALDQPRAAAYAVLQAVSEQDAYANLVLPRQLAAAGLTGRDAALATELGYGTLRATGTLDEVLRRCASRDLADIDMPVLNLLRLGAYQLLRTRIPTHAAVATTVDLARATGQGRASGFVNAVLRKVSARDYAGWCDEIARDASPLGALAIRYSHPGWIVAAFADALRVERAESGQPAEELPGELPAALAADDERPETHLVGWPGRIGQAELAAEAGGEPGPYSPYAVRLSSGGEPGALAAVREQRAGVQDEGSQLCALALAGLPLAGPDERWLDLAAGPGGKAALLAALAADRGARLTANELHPHRAELVARATEGWDVEIVVGDSRSRQPDDRGFDRVLLDAPCTGLGALRRRPEARWRRSPADLDELTALQAELLDAALRLARPGGLVAYVTCSPHLAETRQQVERVLAGGLAELVDARPAFAGVPDLGDSAMVQLWPHRHGTDAMFFAALRRR